MVTDWTDKLKDDEEPPHLSNKLSQNLLTQSHDSHKDQPLGDSGRAYNSTNANNPSGINMTTTLET